jgi:hypothetical protein
MEVYLPPFLTSVLDKVSSQPHAEVRKRGPTGWLPYSRPEGRSKPLKDELYILSCATLIFQTWPLHMQKNDPSLTPFAVSTIYEDESLFIFLDLNSKD